ncbi:hypothetical protein JM83_1850 [Gillisia sp. Hel_I_86]|nr:hypothetical protein JM83_1850 [Gillisia sp. Hel_I_86]
MEYLLLIVGALLYLSVVIDIVQTTLSMQGGGWLTSPFSHLFWVFLLKVSGKNLSCGHIFMNGPPFHGSLKIFQSYP